MRLTYKVPYVLPAKNYSYLIQANELKYDTVETKEDDDDTHPMGFPLFMMPYKPAKPPVKKKIEYTNVSSTGKEFSIFYTPDYEITITIDSMDTSLNKYKVHVEKRNKMTQATDSFFCLISCEIVKGLFI